MKLIEQEEISDYERFEKAAFRFSGRLHGTVCVRRFFAEGTEALPRVMAMKGPTAMGLSKLMTDEAASYDFSIASAIDEITPNW